MEGEGSSFEYNPRDHEEDEESQGLMEEDDQMEMSDVNGYSDLSEGE